jgi:hypothetical protein
MAYDNARRGSRIPASAGEASYVEQVARLLMMENEIRKLKYPLGF